MKTLIAAYIDDGYLYGASDYPLASHPSFWLALIDEDHGFTLVKLVDVPDALSEKFEAQGTSEQEFSDGYEAANAAIPYVGEVVATWGLDDDDYEEKQRGMFR